MYNYEVVSDDVTKMGLTELQFQSQNLPSEGA